MELVHRTVREPISEKECAQQHVDILKQCRQFFPVTRASRGGLCVLKIAAIEMPHLLGVDTVETKVATCDREADHEGDCSNEEETRKMKLDKLKTYQDAEGNFHPVQVTLTITLAFMVGAVITSGVRDTAKLAWAAIEEGLYRVNQDPNTMLHLHAIYVDRSSVKIVVFAPEGVENDELQFRADLAGQYATEYYEKHAPQSL